MFCLVSQPKSEKQERGGGSVLKIGELEEVKKVGKMKGRERIEVNIGEDGDYHKG